MMKTRRLSQGVTLMTLIASTLYAQAAPQTQERTIRRLPIERNEPLAITDTKVNGRSVSFDQKFVANDDWIRSLVISVKNKSDKLILFAELDLFFPRPTNSKNQLAMFNLLFYGNHPLLTRPPTPDERLAGIAPGETVEIGFSVQNFVGLQQFLAETGYSAGIKKLDLRIGRVIFEDDTMWGRDGSLRRDPNNPGSWHNVNP